MTLPSKTTPLHRLIEEKKAVQKSLMTQQEQINTSASYLGANYRSIVIYALKNTIFPAEKSIQQQTTNAFLASAKSILIPVAIEFLINKVMTFFARKMH